ncbi:hypothetical protein GN958_ATG02552 [Phytophthora infestans]|uniref:Uncharacterized protein n=1 Tax=Phytophthora infestans TaxID=4787 RepID=A0A8S9VCE2_PHYIN|nr:hypothetical protein GN958_ATG02552 [Phytophthora infestans]
MVSLHALATLLALPPSTLRHYSASPSFAFKNPCFGATLLYSSSNREQSQLRVETSHTLGIFPTNPTITNLLLLRGLFTTLLMSPRLIAFCPCSIVVHVRPPFDLRTSLNFNCYSCPRWSQPAGSPPPPHCIHNTHTSPNSPVSSTPSSAVRSISSTDCPLEFVKSLS